MRAFPGRLGLMLLVLAGLYLVGNDRVGLWDRDEPRYAQTSRQMAFSSPPDWVVPRFFDRVRTAKPIFIYWCQAASMCLLGGNEFAARLPSALAMLATLGLLGLALGRWVGRRRALWSIFILGTCALGIAVAKMCITDAVLLLWITLAQLCLYAIYRGNRSWGVTVGLWGAVGLAGLTKGPVVLGVGLMTLLVLAALDMGQPLRSALACLKGRRVASRAGAEPSQQSAVSSQKSEVSSEAPDFWATLRRLLGAIAWWRNTRPLFGLFLVAAIVGPWLLSLHLRQPGFLRQTLSHDVVRRSLEPLEGHKGPPGFYLLTIWATYFPWSLLLPMAVATGWKNRRLPPLRFALAAVLGPWLMLEAVQTKLVHYLLPAYPALAFLTADGLVRAIRRARRARQGSGPTAVRGLRAMDWLGLGLWGLFVLAAGVVPWLGVWKFAPLPASAAFLAGMIAAGCLAYAATVVLCFRSQRPAAAATAMGAGMILLIALFYGLYLPQAHFLWLPQRIAQALERHGAQGQVVHIGYDEDSLGYYHGQAIGPAQVEQLHPSNLGHWPAWIVLTRSAWNALPPATRSRLHIVESLQGWAYASKGHRVEVMIVSPAMQDSSIHLSRVEDSSLPP